jgi:hypothetical protein
MSSLSSGMYVSRSTSGLVKERTKACICRLLTYWGIISRWALLIHRPLGAGRDSRLACVLPRFGLKLGGLNWRSPSALTQVFPSLARAASLPTQAIPASIAAGSVACPMPKLPVPARAARSASLKAPQSEVHRSAAALVLSSTPFRISICKGISVAPTAASRLNNPARPRAMTGPPSLTALNNVPAPNSVNSVSGISALSGYTYPSPGVSSRP